MNRNNSPMLKREEGGTLLGVFIGLLCGLAIAAGIAYWLNRGPNPFQAAQPALSKLEPITKADGKPRFDFYKILPGGEEPKTAGSDSKSETKSNGSAKAGERYYLQTGAFQNEAEAEDQKAKLAFMGLESSVQSGADAEKKTWYRVRLGPYDNAEEMNRIKTELTRRGLEASVIKVQ